MERLCNAPAADPTNGNHAIVAAGPTVPTPRYRAPDMATECDTAKTILRFSASRLMQFRSIDIGESDFDPCRRVWGRANAETIAVADIADTPGEDAANLAWEGRSAGVCKSRCTWKNGKRQ